MTEPTAPVTNPPTRRRFRWRRWLGILALLLVALFIGGRQWAWSARQAKFAELRARGEPVFFEDLADPGPVEGTAVPATLRACYLLGSDTYSSTDPNARQSLKEAIPDLDGLRPVAYDKSIQNFAGAPFAKNPTLDVALAALKPIRAAVAEAVDLPPGRLTRRLNVDNPFMTMLPSVQNMRELGRIQMLAVGQAVTDKRPRDAYRELVVLLKLPRLLEREPFLISYLVGAALTGTGCATLEQLLAAADPTGEEFLLIDRLLAENGDRLRVAPALLAERASMMSMVERPRMLGSTAALGIPSGPGLEALWVFYGSTLCDARRWSDQVWLARHYDEWLALIDDVGPGAEGRVAALDARVKDLTQYNPVLRIFMPALATCHAAGLRMRTRLVEERVALRVHRFKMRTGKLPESLAELADPLMVPMPLFADKLPTYNRDPQGFSIGSPRAPRDPRQAYAWRARIKYIPDPPEPATQEGK